MSNVRTIVTIGGGSGQQCLLGGLKTLPRVEVRAIVSMMDSGGSSGRLRNALGILPPGDVLKCLVALSNRSEDAKALLLQRFTQDPHLAGHRVGNLLLTMLAEHSGSFPAAIAALAEILDVSGSVLPVTLDKATLVAELEDGSRVCGESAIDLPHDRRRSAIRSVFLVPHHVAQVSAHSAALEAIQDATCVVLGPGDLFTSLLANLAVPGIVEALRASRARMLYVVNIMTKFGETQGFSAADFVRTVERCLDRPLDVIVCNTRRPPAAILSRYRRQGADWVAPLEAGAYPTDEHRVLGADLLQIQDGTLRHHALRLAALVGRILAPAAARCPQAP
jgi:uncharacterized cofD-like protein